MTALDCDENIIRCQISKSGTIAKVNRLDGRLRQTFLNGYGHAVPALAWSQAAAEGLLEVTGEEEIDGTKVYKVEFNQKDSYPATRYFDAETGLVKRLETSQEFPQLGEVNITVSYSDYQDHDGVKMAMNHAYVLEGVASYTISYSEVSWNAEVNDTEFELPDEIRELVEGGDN